MHRFASQEIINGVLLPLPDLLSRLPKLEVSFWCLRDFELHCGKPPFGMTYPVFERRSRDEPGGVCLTPDEFNGFLRSDPQIMDGVIDVRSGPKLEVVLRIECIDTGIWILSTSSDVIADGLRALGWKPWFGPTGGPN